MCASVTMKLQIGIHRRDLFPYYVVFEASKAPPSEFMGVIYAPRLGLLGSPTTEPFNTNAGATRAAAHIMQFANGVGLPDGGPDRFQPGLTSYSSPAANDYSPMWHITQLFFDCNRNGTFFLEDRNVSFGAAPSAGSGIAGFDPADPATFSPFGMDDGGVDCTEFAIEATGNPDGFIYVDELEHLKQHGYVTETQAPGGWTGVIKPPLDLQRPLIVNCPTHVSVDLRK
jgi:hypothetical protein